MIDRNKPQPLYYQVKEVIMSEIKTGKLKPGEKLLSEGELREKYGVSRNTIRQALKELSDEGWIEIRHGKGSFVSSRKITLNFASWLAAEKTGEEVIKFIKSEFEKAYPVCELNVIPIPFSNMEKQLTKMVSAGSAPDIAQIRSNWTVPLVSTGALEPLSGLINSRNLADRIEEIDLQSGRYKDNLYSVAWTIAPLVLYINMNILGKVDLDHFIPRTFDELHNISLKLIQESKSDIYGTGIPAGIQEITGFWTSLFIRSKGGDLIDDQGNVTIDSKNTVEAFKWLKKSIDDGSFFLFEDIKEVRKNFARNKLAFMVDVPPSLGRLKEWASDDLNLKLSLIPTGDSDISESWVVNQSLCIFKQSSNKDLAAKFIEFLTSNSKVVKRCYKEVGFVPPLRSQLKLDIFNNDPYISVFTEQMKTASTFPANHSLFSVVMYFFVLAIRDILEEGVPIEEELKKQGDAIRKLISFKNNIM